MFHIKIKSKLEGYDVIEVKGPIRVQDYKGKTIYCLVERNQCINLGAQYGIHYLCIMVTEKDPEVFSIYKIDGKTAIFTLDTIEKGAIIINFIDEEDDFEI